jgi:hypothetical protein
LETITWGSSDLNALQLEQLKKFTRDDYVRIRKEYAEWQKNLTVVPSYVYAALGLGALVAWNVSHTGWVRIVAVVVGITAFYALCRREGHAEGYVEGYEAGHEDGINKAFGIKPEERKELHEFATQMKLDQIHVRAFEKKNPE